MLEERQCLIATSKQVIRTTKKVLLRNFCSTALDNHTGQKYNIPKPAIRYLSLSVCSNFIGKNYLIV